MERVSLEVKWGRVEIMEGKGKKVFGEYGVWGGVYVEGLRCLWGYGNGCVLGVGVGLYGWFMCDALSY